MNRPIALIAAGLVMLGATACTGPMTDSASAPVVTASPIEVQTLRERAASYWAARMSEDDQAQWELLEPRGKGRMTAKEYAAGRHGVRYLGYQVEDAIIDGYFAVVKVRLLVQAMHPRLAAIPPQPILIDDQWVRVGGSWYRQTDTSQPQKR